MPGDIPGDLMVKYYGQRASDGGLIITEATAISVTAPAVSGSSSNLLFSSNAGNGDLDQMRFSGVQSGLNRLANLPM